MFRDKEYVYEVWKERSFSKAAARLYISQPSLSAKIKRIEAELGAVIFDRSTSPLRLTEFGEAYLQAIGEVKGIERRIENRINDMNTLHLGAIGIGASNVFAAYVLPPIIARFKTRFPNVQIRLVEGNTATLEELLSSNEIDIVLDNNHYDAELYEKVEYASERILLAVPSDFPACRDAAPYALPPELDERQSQDEEPVDAVPLSLFRKVPFVLLTSGNDTRIRADRLCKEAGFRPNVVLEVNQQATAYMIATTRIGATFVSDTVVRRLPAHRDLTYYNLRGEHASRTISFTVKKHKHKSRAMQEFLKLISERDV